MKLFFIILSFVVLAHVVTCVPSAVRERRDVSELVAKPQNTYLAPPAAEEVDIAAESNTEIPSEESEHQESFAALGKNGYEYKTVRKLRFRNRRDVSHLKMHYLPPTNEYLPPVEVKAAQISTEAPQSTMEPLEPASVEELDIAKTEQPEPNNVYLPPVNIKESQIASEQLQPSNEYLPPINVKEAEIAKEVSQPSNEYLPPAKLEEFSDMPAAEPSVKTNEDIKTEAEADISEMTTVASLDETDIESEFPEDTAILLEDGYHYKKPADIPNLFPQSTTPSMLFLPPLEEAIVDGPSNGESAVLAKDGYHYRAIKRRF